MPIQRSGAGRHRTGERTTLAAVAARADVSVSSVSKVLNGRPGVSEATRARVEELLHAGGYSPRGAPAFANVIELVFFELDTEWMLEVLQGVEALARSGGCRVMLTPSRDLLNPDRGWIDDVIGRRPRGVILVFSGLTPRDVERLDSRSIPFAVVDPAGDPAPGVPYVRAQNWAGGLEATEHLIGLGHQRIGIVTGPSEQLCSRARLAGFASAMGAAGLEVPDAYVRPGRFHHADGLDQGRDLLALPDRPTAIFACSDLQALGVYEAAAEAGLDIPRDLSVVGFDDLRLARWTGPPLTTVHQPIKEMAEFATRLVMDQGSAREPQLELATRLVVRASTAPPAA
jgi:LacI family xylobiose transport system transcriptional regulator